MITLTHKQQIILKHIDGMSNREIARILHISKDTVNKYISEYRQQKEALLLANPQTDCNEIIQSIVEKPKYNASTRKPIKVTDDVLEIIEECLEANRVKRSSGRTKQVMKKIDIYELLKAKNFDISYSTVKRLVEDVAQRHNEAYIRQEYLPGAVCEFDWGEVKLNIDNQGFKPYQMAVFTAAKSNYRFAMLFRAQDTAAFQQSHTEFFDYCGGTFQTMVYDNMKVAVKRFVGLYEKEPTKALSELSIYYGFKFRFCNIASGNEKGHVERSVEFLRRKAFSIQDHFSSLDEANVHLLATCTRLNHQRIYNGLIPSQVFKEEQSHLGFRLPKFESCIATEVRVDKYATVIFSQNHYSVPDDLVGKMVLLKAYTDKIVIYHNSLIVATHTRSYKNHDWVIEIKHYLRTLYKKPGALTHSTALLKADTRIQNIYNYYYNKDPKGFLEVLHVIYERGLDIVETALKELEVISPLDMSCEKVQAICDHRLDVLHREREYIDPISLKARETLSNYNHLTLLQHKAVM